MDPAYLETVSMSQLYDTVFEAKEYSLLWKVFGRERVEGWIQQTREKQQEKKRQTDRWR